MPNGYSKIGYHGKTYLGHRLVWEMYNGLIPDDLCICHHCDNRKCVNPDHLFMGTRTENMQDMIMKGRQNFSGLRTNGAQEKANENKLSGADHPNSSITTEKADSIAFLYVNEGLKQTQLSERFGISQAAVSRIVRGEHWTQLRTVSSL